MNVILIEQGRLQKEGESLNDVSVLSGAERAKLPPADPVEEMKCRALSVQNGISIADVIKSHFPGLDDYFEVRRKITEALLEGRMVLLSREDLRSYLPMAYQTEERIERELRSQIANLEFQFIQVEKLLCEALGREWRPSGFSIASLIEDIKSKLGRDGDAK